MGQKPVISAIIGLVTILAQVWTDFQLMLEVAKPSAGQPVKYLS